MNDKIQIGCGISRELNYALDKAIEERGDTKAGFIRLAVVNELVRYYEMKSRVELRLSDDQSVEAYDSAASIFELVERMRDRRLNNGNG